ncbi:bifunctional diaminohydroxyphosphoribosylaminopyrimidine deaminase/5-amino-6-(5-phosphoribosylamino)uracil reductase RibD [Planctomyces sp. SH-PL14]|uniref:bifunctional diaminohydroxyphosphoribosylaminopyrimidine deaminase/5-amino-6-(5-phosphoribosylamino)uracil reductase RibD n=1 Tax=Planctomyces sp. SH-PL14 TaxID=1632864 RepID=UPI0018D486A6|nr:bifunctional diaminohydroxyphosphoribosylaminopyrimidine deaminase/5-amino-6-(5-phosphoribosylamino)uracil reductase RibD [Planctomyces sp. SH-PL14]
MPITFSSDEEAMRRALELARRGRGLVEPNPMVGAVVVSPEGELVGEGNHERFGGPHAEVNALRAAGDRAGGGTLYCTLEPCSHFGKTPPCAPLVVSSGIRRVVLGTGDPAPHVAGRGIAILREAGIEVIVGVCEAEARQVVAPFVTLMTLGRPYVHAKWAMSLDGRIATRTGHSQWISNERSRARVHELRGRMDAILVGRGTAVADDPLLTARPPGPRTPLRIVLDSTLQTPIDCQLVQTAQEFPTLVATTSAADAVRREAFLARGVEVELFDAVPSAAADGSASPRVSIPALLSRLGQRKLTNLLVEGGGDVLGAFHDAGLLDEYHVFVAPKIIGGASAKSPLGGFGTEQVMASGLSVVATESLDGDVYINAVQPR